MDAASLFVVLLAAAARPRTASYGHHARRSIMHHIPELVFPNGILTHTPAQEHRFPRLVSLLGEHAFCPRQIRYHFAFPFLQKVVYKFYAALAFPSQNLRCKPSSLAQKKFFDIETDIGKWRRLRLRHKASSYCLTFLCNPLRSRTRPECSWHTASLRHRTWRRNRRESTCRTDR